MATLAKQDELAIILTATSCSYSSTASL